MYKLVCTFAGLTLSVMAAFAGGDFSYASRVRAYAMSQGLPESVLGPNGRVVVVSNPDGTGSIRWRVPEVPEPTEQTLPSKEAAESILAAHAAAQELVRQAAKPLERKVLENNFYVLVQQILVAASDPRADEPTTPKLGFDEITAVIEVIQAADPLTAITFSVKLLSIDAALKRYNTLWWEDAVQHVIPEA